jgi:hypothetical protein
MSRPRNSNATDLPTTSDRTKTMKHSTITVTDLSDTLQTRVWMLCV